MDMKKKLIAIVAALCVTGSGSAYYVLSYAPHQKAVTSFNKAVQDVKGKNKPLKHSINEAEKLIKSNQKPLDTKTLDNLKIAVKASKNDLRKIPKAADKTDDIKKQTKALNQPLDYSASIKTLTDNSTAYKNSVKQLSQITNPKQQFIEERLKEIDTIQDIQAVTEANDPNSLLNKQGGYTASIYFTDSQVTEAIDGNDVVEKGNDAGGNIEVYKTKEEAEKRNSYLSSFDGQGFLNPGSHYVYGTIVIRTSRFLTASQQEQLTKKIYEKLIEIKDGETTEQPQKKKENSSNASSQSQPSTVAEQESQHTSASSTPKANQSSQKNNTTTPSSEEIPYNGLGSAWGNYDGDYENGYLDGYEDGLNASQADEVSNEMTEEELHKAIQDIQDSRAYYAPNEFENWE